MSRGASFSPVIAEGEQPVCIAIRKRLVTLKEDGEQAEPLFTLAVLGWGAVLSCLVDGMSMRATSR